MKSKKVTRLLNAKGIMYITKIYSSDPEKRHGDI